MIIKMADKMAAPYQFASIRWCGYSNLVIFIPRHTLVARYYVIPFGVCPSVRPSVLTISDR